MAIEDFTDIKQLALEIKKELGVESHETLKLEKNSKGYNWEIKIFSDKTDTDLKAVERLELINNSLVARFGAEDGNSNTR
jgi:hypothetical protein